MSSKVFPALLLVVFLILLIVSFKPTRTRSATTTAATTDTAKVMMKKYWMVLLKKGPNRDQNEALAELIQKKHIANIERLAKSGKMLVAGPFEDDGELRGIFILDCADSAEAEGLVRTDTAIITGRLTYEIKAWWTAKNCVFK